MKRVWSREDTEQLRAAMERHPAYIARQERERGELADWEHEMLDPTHKPALAPVIDIHTRERIA